MWYFIGIPNFIKIVLSAAELWRHSDFQDGGRQPCWIWFRAIIAHARSANGGLCFILKFRLDRIYSFGDRAISYFGILAWNCLFTPIFRRFWGHIFPKWRHLSSWPPKCTSLRGNTSFEPHSVQIGPPVRPGRRIEKKRTGHDSQKVTKALYFTYLGISPHWTDFHRNLHSSCRLQHNHVCNLLNWNVQGLRFYKGWNFPLSYNIYWFFHGPYSSAALTRCLWWPWTRTVQSHPRSNVMLPIDKPLVTFYATSVVPIIVAVAIFETFDV